MLRLELRDKELHLKVINKYGALVLPILNHFHNFGPIEPLNQLT